MTTITTFSGAHPFRPQCLVDAIVYATSDTPDDPLEDDRDDAVITAADIVARIGGGHCARCDSIVAPPEIPSGSRITSCRCIPICAACSTHEALADEQPSNTPSQARDWLTLNPSPASWPIGADQKRDADALVRAWRSKSVPGLLKMSTTTHIEITDDGIVEVQDPGLSVDQIAGRAHPGGWLEHGFDDSEDEQERQR